VSLNQRGGWEVALPDKRSRIVCRTLDEARQVGYRCAAGRPPCELVVHDAYHRVLERELLVGEPAPL
jgi:hypothetical protein